jgi:predicted aspartyl protease
MLHLPLALHSCCRYNATTHLVQDPSAHMSYYTMPYTPLLPEDASYDSEGEHQLAAWHCASGHIVVEVELAGQPAGFMLLDTGANGFVIEQETADRLELQDFGELYAFSIAGVWAGACCCQVL